MIVIDGEDARGLDRALTAGLLAGGRQGLHRTYLRYADRLFEYCLGLVPDPDAAADALHDAFVVVGQRAAELGEPDRLRGWLYALARNECLRLLADRDREPAEPPEPAPEQWDPVRDVVGRLPHGNREAYQLAARHGLPDHDIAEVLGISEPQVQTRLARADAELARALPPGPDGSTEDLLATYREARFAAAPAVLWPRVELNCFDPGLEPERTAVVRRAGRFVDPETGFPEPLDVRRRRRALVAGVVGAAAAVVGLLVLAAGAVAWLDQPATPPAQAGAPPGLPPAAGTPTPTGSAPPASLSPTGTGTPSPSAPPQQPVPPAQSTRPPAGAAPVEVAADAERDCVVGGLFGYTLRASATASRPLTAAALVVVTDAGTEEFPMDVERDSASAESEVLTDREAQWFVEVTTVDDQAATTALETVPEDCS